MIRLIPREKVKTYHPGRKEVTDLLLFLLVSLLMPVFTLGQFSFAPTPEEGFQPGFYHFVFYYPGKAPQWYFSIPLILIYSFLCLYLLYRMKKEIRFHRIVFVIWSLFVVSRLISLLFFPYGSQDYQFISPFDQSVISLSYPGFTIYERIITYFYDICFYSYFAFFFTVFPILSKKHKVVFNLIFLVIQMIVLSMVIYSLITEQSKVWNNLYVIFVNPSSNLDISMTSYTSHRNAFGFFLLVGVIFALADFLEEENLFSLLLFFFYLFFCTLISSRTPLILLWGILVFLLILYPLFNFNRHMILSGVFLFLLFFLIFYFFISFTFFQNTYWKTNIMPLFSDLFDFGSMHARSEITTSALSMSQGYYLIFGYSKYPFITIFSQYIHHLPTDPNVNFSSHNTYIDILMQYGIIGFTLFFFVIALFFYYLSKEFFYYHHTSALRYLGLLVVCLCYCYSEPRFLLLNEGTSILFVLMLMLPFVKDDTLFREQDTIGEKKKI